MYLGVVGYLVGFVASFSYMARNTSAPGPVVFFLALTWPASVPCFLFFDACEWVTRRLRG
jgi:hypothetical protein